MLVLVLATLLPIQFPVNVPGRTVENGSVTCPPAFHVGDLDGIPRSYLWPDPVLIIAVI